MNGSHRPHPDESGTDDEEAQRVRLLEAAFRSVPFAVYVQDRASGYAMSNPPQDALCDFALRPRADRAIVDGQSGQRRDRAQILAEDAHVLETGTALELPAVTYIHPDGHATLHHIRKMPLRDTAGRVIGLLKISEEVTEHRRTVEALNSQRRLLQAVFDVIPVWVFVKDPARRFVLINGRMADELGLPRQPAAKQLLHLELDVSEEDRRLLWELDREVVRTGRSALSRPIGVRLPAGGTRLFRTLRAPWRDEAGELQGIVGFAEDITERVKTNQALQQMQKLDTLGLLAGGLAHDFNNLLVTILGTTELVRHALRPEDRLQDPLQTIELAGQRAADLCRQVLAFAGKGRLRSGLTYINDVVRETLSLLRVILTGRAGVHLELWERLPAVQGDRAQLQQVLMNLVVNAAEALPEEGGIITLTSRPVEADEQLLQYFVRDADVRPGPFVEVTVRDNGSGMDSQTLSRIFDPFFTTKASGSGLGLSTTVGIVRSHGGAIRVESEPGRGTTFLVLLPAADAAGPG